jgi:hypothetical protein
MNLSHYFPSSFAEAQAKFRDAARDAGARLSTFKNPAPAPAGVTLSTESAWLGPSHAERLLILLSGTHGVECFCGSGLQIGFLDSGLAAERPDSTAILMIHAINPSGFAWSRRVTEGNVDLNRNFVDHKRPYPRNPAYEQLREAICPRDWSPAGQAAANAILDDYARVNGEMALQTAISQGQYIDPAGLFFGGRAPTWSNLILREILRREAGAARLVAFVDLHTGLGPYGVGEIINNHLTGHPGFQRVKDWFGAEATSSEEGSSSSATVIGDTNIGIDESLPLAAVAGITLEFGSAPLIDVREALRADNWLYVHGKPDSAEGRAITTQLRKAFYPDKDDWRDMVWERAVDVTRRTLASLAQSNLAPADRPAPRSIPKISRGRSHAAKSVKDAAAREHSMAELSQSTRRGLRGAYDLFMRQYGVAKETQASLLQDILHRNADTEFGREHGFGTANTVEAYRRQVPIRQWSEIGPYVDRVVGGRDNVLTRDVPFFFHRTTGTTGKPKMIPFTRRCQASAKLTHRMWVYKNVLDNPGVLKGRVFAILNAGVDGYTERREPYGSVSGNIYFRLPSILRRRYSHPYDVYHIESLEARRYALLRFAVEQSCSFACTGNPSSLLAAFEFCDQQSESLIQDIHDGTLASRFDIPDPIRAFALNALLPNPRRARALAKARQRAGRLQPADYWPDLHVLGCWIGGSMGHFAPRLREWCAPGLRFRDAGYMASEGVFSIPLKDDSPDGVLTLHSNFYEFVPEHEFGRPDARVLLAHEIEPGENYHVVITTTGGLYRYAMNDVIRVGPREGGSPTVRFLYKGGNVQNIQGEMVTVDHVTSTMGTISRELGINVHHFQVVAELGARRYVLHVEPSAELPAPVLARLLPSFDRELGKNNENYAMFRADGLINAPGLRVMRRGWFDRISSDHIARSKRESQSKPSLLASAVEHPEMIEKTLELA